MSCVNGYINYQSATVKTYSFSGLLLSLFVYYKIIVIHFPTLYYLEANHVQGL